VSKTASNYIANFFLFSIAMSVLSRTISLGEVLSPGSQILTDSNDATFRELVKRWSDIDLKTPAAIILPISEEDIQKMVGS